MFVDATTGKNPLQWGRDVIVAEIAGLRLRHLPSKLASMGPRRYRRGNPLTIDRGKPDDKASMGPRRYRRGNPSWPSGHESTRPSFNGAATLSSRKSHAAGGRILYSSRFNGAATLSSRKSHTRTSYPPLGASLQWGRDVIVAEIDSHRTLDTTRYELQWGRDVIVAEIAKRLPRAAAPRRFNGAATLSSRK